MSTPSPDFLPVDWNAPLVVEDYIKACPIDGVVRGMFFDHLLEAAAERGIGLAAGRRYTSFRHYPIREFLRLTDELIGLSSEPPRVLLRAVGHRAFPEFAATMAGRAIFSVAGREFARVALLATRAYAVNVRPGKVTTEFTDPKRLFVRMRDLYTFPDCYQLGVWEGAMQLCGVSGTFRIRPYRELCNLDAELLLE